MDDSVSFTRTWKRGLSKERNVEGPTASSSRNPVLAAGLHLAGCLRHRVSRMHLGRAIQFGIMLYSGAGWPRNTVSTSSPPVQSCCDRRLTLAESSPGNRGTRVVKTVLRIFSSILQERCDGSDSASRIRLRFLDEIVVVDCFDQDIHCRMRISNALSGLNNVRVYYVVSLGYADALRAYGLSNWATYLDTDERGLRLLRRLIVGPTV
jgi:hypothetical protein